ncbi:tyrosine-type recombinase/integrase [Streptomyces sp. NPDC055400]
MPRGQSDAQKILDDCEHLRDRLLFALLLDTGVRIGEALGLRHDDIAIAEKQVMVVPRQNDNRARATAGRTRTVPASAELQIAGLWEVEFKGHSHDTVPTSQLALSEPEARALVALRTELV